MDNSNKANMHFSSNDDLYDVYSQNDSQDFNIMKELKKADKGYNVIYRKFYSTKHDRMKRYPVDVYTSSGKGSFIRNAETGLSHKFRISSKNEDLFFKVSLATGECNSKNGFSTLFYDSPAQYIEHTNSSLSWEIISKWEAKRNARLAEMNKEQEFSTASSITVK